MRGIVKGVVKAGFIDHGRRRMYLPEVYLKSVGLKHVVYRVSQIQLTAPSEFLVSVKVPPDLEIPYPTMVPQLVSRPRDLPYLVYRWTSSEGDRAGYPMHVCSENSSEMLKRQSQTPSPWCHCCRRLTSDESRLQLFGYQRAP